jgi:hypothetical protein
MRREWLQPAASSQASTVQALASSQPLRCPTQVPALQAPVTQLVSQSAPLARVDSTH